MSSPNSNCPITIDQLLKQQREQIPDKPALIGVDREPLSYAGLADFADEIGGALSSMGLSYPARIAVVMPNGPETAAAFVAISTAAACAPLNPAYRADEFEFYLTDLNAAAVLVDSRLDCSVREVAAKLGIPLLEAHPDSRRAAGCFSINTSGAQSLSSVSRSASPDDVALLLHSSGTTSRPKLVPLSHGNLCASARNIRETLRLAGDDTCLNVMPLFHIHGLVGCLLSTLRSGASIVCSPGFDAVKFFGWLRHYRPTWYSAVPTMHQAVLQESSRQTKPSDGWPLRFIRSSSSALPPSALFALEDFFSTTVIEAYGMTEASHQMACNQLPPGVRKPGTVGRPTGLEITILDNEGQSLPMGARGEVAIKGPSVTAGYVNNPGANRAAFTGEWFRTGDQGFFDEDGHLTISGRLKEIINRGGEKISPREVDEALLEHTAIQEVLAFAVPHPRLGEDLAAAVVLKAGATVTEHEVREFAFGKLADFKVPSQVIFVHEIPKGPTGKLQRIGLHAKLTDQLRTEFVPPKTPTEKQLADLWGNVLGVERVGIAENFFALGGDSLLATQVTSRIRDAFGLELPLPTIFREPTISALAQVIDRALVEQLARDATASELLARLEGLTDEEAERLLMEASNTTD
jgi:acyl-CoA synthetase (AMP-forming)/AMP-acid ligase II/acyl carrier protein